MRLFTLFIFISIFQYSNAQNSIDSKIIELLEITNSTERFNLVIDNMIDIQKEALKDNSRNKKETKKLNNFLDDFRKEMKKEGINDLYELVIPIYKKHISEDELDAIISFYKSSAGQSYLKKSPLIMNESMQVGAEWGKKIAAKIIAKIEEKK